MPHMASEELHIGLLGCGTVGSAVVRLLQTNAEEIHRRTGVWLRVARIAAANPSKPRDLRLDAGILTGDAGAVVADERVDVVAEVMGGIDPARALLLEAMRRGKSVVTANKLLMACHGPELFAEAARAGVDLRLEASVGGGVPVIQPLRESLAANRLHEEVERFLVRSQRWREAALVTHGSGEPAPIEQAAQHVIDLHPLAGRLVERGGAVGHDHELLEVERVRGVPAAVDHVHERHGEKRGRFAAERPVERTSGGGRRGARARERNGEDGVRSQTRLVGGAVERDEPGVDRRLIADVESAEARTEDVVHVPDRAEHPLARVATRVSVAQLDRFVGSGRGARRDRCPARGAARDHDGRLDRRLPP